jgi:dipeptidyl aminopeptidase/acylaminoacyl peptidase
MESRPKEGGRNVIIHYSAKDTFTNLTPLPFNVRTRVHEYGGCSFLATQGSLYFSNFSDQRIYHHTHDALPQPLTPEGYCYAEGILDRRRQRLLYIREDQTLSKREPTNAVVSLGLNPSDAQHPGDVLVSGGDFYSTLRLSPDGNQLAWVTWNHPNMPWDGTELWVAPIHTDGTLGQGQKIAGGPTESIFQPEWSPDGILYFISDRSGWWNLYRHRQGQNEALYPMEAEFGEPQWALGVTTYAFHSADQLICTYSQGGTWHLAKFHIPNKTLEPIPLSFTEIGGPIVLGNKIFCSASSPSQPNALVRIDLLTQQVEVIRQSMEAHLDSRYLSACQPIEYPTEQGHTAHAFFYKPHNGDYTGPHEEKPPLLVKSHGGPTGAASSAFNLMIQFWTSRGFAVLDVNYGGSTGYGRAYRERLNGQWGIVDVDDCVNAVRYLIQRGEVDPHRVTITGGSAGGYTTLSALTFRDVFTAGSSYYGVSDLEALAQDTHKFESRYLDNLIGPYPERADVYRERSPIHFTESLSCPLILFQGLEDKVVPPNQAERMFEAVKAKGIPVAYLAFEGEQHGFRRAENIKKVLEGELYFYSKIFKFVPADKIEPIVIENLPD